MYVCTFVLLFTFYVIPIQNSWKMVPFSFTLLLFFSIPLGLYFLSLAWAALATCIRTTFATYFANFTREENQNFNTVVPCISHGRYAHEQISFVHRGARPLDRWVWVKRKKKRKTSDLRPTKRKKRPDANYCTALIHLARKRRPTSGPGELRSGRNMLNTNNKYHDKRWTLCLFTISLLQQTRGYSRFFFSISRTNRHSASPYDISRSMNNHSYPGDFWRRINREWKKKIVKFISRLTSDTEDLFFNHIIVNELIALWRNTETI